MSKSGKLKEIYKALDAREKALFKEAFSTLATGGVSEEMRQRLAEATAATQKALWEFLDADKEEK